VGLLHRCGKPAYFAGQVEGISAELTEALFYRASFLLCRIVSAMAGFRQITEVCDRALSYPQSA